MKNKLVLILFSLCLRTSCTAQDVLNQAQIIERYWNYRYNLVGDRVDPSYPAWPAGMMYVNDCQGCSLPASAAYPDRQGLLWSENLYRLAHY
jgi:hypothetical protein